MDNHINTDSIFYKKFVECYLQGASIQDIYTDSKHGYAADKIDEPHDSHQLNEYKEEAHEEFTRIFDHLRNLVEPIEKKFSFNGKKVLDFGCGTGALSIAMALKGANVLGVDPTPISLEACKYRAQYFKMEESFTPLLIPSTPGLPFADNSFDIVFTNSVFEFIPFNREEYIAELLRVVNPSGLLIIATENGLFPYDYYTKMLFPRFRRKQAISNNLPYGISYFELLLWIKSSQRKVINISKKNLFNSIDKVGEQKKKEGKTALAWVMLSGNAVFKCCCRMVSLPSDIFLPYAMFIFKVKE